MRDKLMAATGWLLAPDTDPVARHQAVGLAALRILLGLMWLYNVAWKRPPGFGEDSGSGLYKFTSYAVEYPVFPPYSWVAEHVILPYIEIFGWLVLATETALAVMLLSGVLMRAAAALGISQSLAIGLSVAYAPEEWPWSYMLMIGAHLALLVASSGRVFSVDSRRSGVSSGVVQQRVWGVLALVVAFYSLVASAGDPLAGKGPGLGFSGLSISLGNYNLLGAVVVGLVGIGLLLASRGIRVAGLGATALAVLAAVLLTAQIGFSTPVLGGNATSVGLLLTLAVIAFPTRTSHAKETSA